MSGWGGGGRDSLPKTHAPPLLIPTSPPHPTPADGVTAYTTRSIWLLALYQCITCLTADALGVVADATFHGVHDAAHWPVGRRPTLASLGMLAALSLGGGGVDCD